MLYEHSAYDERGNCQAGTFLDYLLPTASEIPNIEIHHLETPSTIEANYRGVGEGGMIAGWSPGVDLTHAVTMYTDAGGAVYKGLAVAQNNGKSFLYATDFHNGKIDVFNGTFAR